MCEQMLSFEPAPYDEDAAAAQELAQLVAAAQTGDELAISQVAQRIEPTVRRAARRFTYDIIDQEDLAAVALEKVVTQGLLRGKYLPRDDSNFGNWSYAVTANVARDRARKETRLKRSLYATVSVDALDGEFLPSSSNTAEEATSYATASRMNALFEAAGVAPEYREAVILAHVEGLDYEEIAAVLGVKVGTVRSRINRGLTGLRQFAGLIDESGAKTTATPRDLFAEIEDRDQTIGQAA
jgi:RNA polymerase sigma factor (sigma-70 family)